MRRALLIIFANIILLHVQESFLAVHDEIPQSKATELVKISQRALEIAWAGSLGGLGNQPHQHREPAQATLETSSFRKLWIRLMEVSRSMRSQTRVNAGVFNRQESRSLSKSTRQIAPQTKNGHAPPTT